MFHALRHTHASALIAAGVDVVKISRRLEHADPTVTLRSCAHLFDKVDTARCQGAVMVVVGEVRCQFGAISVPILVLCGYVK
jgi:hypothetical protein